MRCETVLLRVSGYCGFIGVIVDLSRDWIPDSGKQYVWCRITR